MNLCKSLSTVRVLIVSEMIQTMFLFIKSFVSNQQISPRGLFLNTTAS